MTDAAANLANLHDIVIPITIPWWPPAPGWYVVLVLLLLTAAWLLRRFWKRWQSKAYRRAALRELMALQDVPAIAELLRRTALIIAPRPTIAELTGTAWTDWLAAHFPERIPDAVYRQLTVGVYDRPVADCDIADLRDYAARWIARHHADSPDIREGN